MSDMLQLVGGRAFGATDEHGWNGLERERERGRRSDGSDRRGDASTIIGPYTPSPHHPVFLIRPIRVHLWLNDFDPRQAEAYRT